MTMIPPISSAPVGTTPSTDATQTSTGATPGAANSLSSLANSQTFLQLLVAELKYQDPSNPVDPTQFMSQTAQLTEVQAINSLQSQFTQQLSSEQTLMATSLIGKQITAQAPGGAPITGTVSDVTLSASQTPTLNVDGTQISLSDVTDVSASGTGSPTG